MRSSVAVPTLLMICVSSVTFAQGAPYSFKRARIGASFEEVNSRFVDPVFGPLGLREPSTSSHTVHLCQHAEVANR